MTDASVFDSALRIAGLPLHGSRAEKTARLLAHQSKASPKASSPPKKTIVKKQKVLKKKTSPATTSQADFFKKHRPAVMKAFKKEEDRQKELRRLWAEHNSSARSGDSPSKSISKPIIKDHELDQAACRREGLKKIGEKGSKHVYVRIDAAGSTSKTESKKPVLVKKDVASFKAAAKKPVKTEKKKKITLATLKKIADDLSLPSYGNKQKISQRIIAALKNDEEDAGHEPIDIDDDDDVVKNEDDEEEDEEDEDDEEGEEEEDEAGDDDDEDDGEVEEEGDEEDEEGDEEEGDEDEEEEEEDDEEEDDEEEDDEEEDEEDEEE